MTAPTRRIEPADERQLLDAIDRWLEREVKGVVKAHDHDDLYPAAIVEQIDSTTVLRPGWTARVDEFSNLIAEHQNA